MNNPDELATTIVRRLQTWEDVFSGRLVEALNEDIEALSGAAENDEEDAAVEAMRDALKALVARHAALGIVPEPPKMIDGRTPLTPAEDARALWIGAGREFAGETR